MSTYLSLDFCLGEMGDSVFEGDCLDGELTLLSLCLFGLFFTLISNLTLSLRVTGDSPSDYSFLLVIEFAQSCNRESGVICDLDSRPFF